MKIENEQPVAYRKTPGVYSRLEDAPGVWVKRAGVYFTGANKKSYRTNPPLYSLQAVYVEVTESTPGAEKLEIIDPKTFENAAPVWLLELPVVDDVMPRFIK